MRRFNYLTVGFLFASVWVAATCFGGPEKEAQLSEAEDTLLREAQDPGKRIEVYLDIAQTRLDLFEDYRHRPADPKYDHAGYLADLLSDYVAVLDELRNWIEYHYGRGADMRRGLRAVLERGPRQLEALDRIQKSPDGFATEYAEKLRVALLELNDTIDGSTKALAEQQRKFVHQKREEKATERQLKERVKEQEKKAKEEEKLRKRQGRRRVPGESDQD